MSSEIEKPQQPVHPRPGVLKTLGICNIVFSVLGGLCIAWSAYFLFVMAVSGAADPPLPVKVEVQVQAPANSTPKPAVPVAGFSPFMGMNDPGFLRFTAVEDVVGLIINGLMFVTGIGLINLRRWAARLWTATAWARIALVVMLWSYYIVAVAPSLSESMARNVSQMIAQQNPGRGGTPNVVQLTQFYSIANLIVAVGAMLVTSIYPAISIWLLSRPGVKAAIVDKPVTEPELT